MLRRVALLSCLLVPFVFINTAVAGDFDWLRSLSIEARNNPDGFRTQLATRFHIGNAEVQAVINNVGSHADAYMVMRLAEMSHRPVGYVTEHYRSGKSQGWGVMAKKLGIKPGSREFHALKAGHDLNGYAGYYGEGKGKGKNKDKGNKHKNNGKHGRDDD